jgi:hypothetical protein
MAVDNCHLAQHRCLLYTGQCRRHRRVWGDLVPVEQYRLGGFPKHSADTITVPMTLEYVNPDVLALLTGGTPQPQQEQ